MNERKNVVIVGAGMAGLTAAAYLTKGDYNILLMDKNDRVGGLVNTFEYEGFAFDAGPRAFVNSGMVKPMLADLGITCDYLDNKLSLGIDDQMLRVESMDALKDFDTMLKTLFPESTADIDALIPMIAKLSEYTAILYAFDNPSFTDITSDLKQVVRKLLPWLVKLQHAIRQMDKFDTPMEDYLAKITDNQSLIDVVFQHFFRKTPTHFALGYFYVYMDYFYPKGGTGMLARLLKEKVLTGTTEIKLNTQITQVVPAESRVVDATGNSYSYDHLIWAADLKTLYESLDSTGLDAKTNAAIESKAKIMRKAKGAESILSMFIAVDRPPAFFKDRGGEHLFFTPSKQGLGQLNRSIQDELSANFDTTSKQELWDWLDAYCERNTFEVSIPALRDPSLAPEGQTGVMISFLFDYRLVQKIEQAGWYDEFKARVESNIISIFSRTLYPGFADDVLFKFSSTPLSIQKISGSSEGAITGWSFETEIPVANSLTKIVGSVKTPIPNVLQAGQWAYSPAGVPIAMLTGWYATQAIAKSRKRK